MATTLKTAKAALATIGMSINKADGEYVVTHRGERRDSIGAYHTNDIDDAVETGIRMAARYGHPIGRRDYFLYAMHRDGQLVVKSQRVDVVDAPDRSSCCGAFTSVGDDAVPYCKKCFKPV